jgi:hypothetical protein
MTAEQAEQLARADAIKHGIDLTGSKTLISFIAQDDPNNYYERKEDRWDIMFLLPESDDDLTDGARSVSYDVYCQTGEVCSIYTM